MKVFNFIKSIFMPRQMQKYRFMSVLFSFCIFVCSSYLFLIPAKYKFKRNIDKIIEEENPYKLNDFEKLIAESIGNEIAKDLRNKGFKVKQHILTAECDISIKNNPESEKKFSGKLTMDSNKDGNGKYFFDGEPTEIEAKENPPAITVNEKGIFLDDSPLPDKIREKIIDNIEINDNIPLLGIEIDEEGFLVMGGIKTDFVPGARPEIYINDQEKAEIKNEEGETFTIEDPLPKNRNIVYFHPEPMKNRIYHHENAAIYVFPDLNDKPTIYRNDDIRKIDADFDPDKPYFVLMLTRNAMIYYSNNSDSKQLSPISINWEKTQDFKDPSFINELLKKGLIDKKISQYTIVSVLYTLIFPFIVTFLFFLIFRSTGRMRTIKEYYNIAALAALVPMILTFAVLWIPQISCEFLGNIYLPAFAVYYLFVLYRINSTAEMI